MSECGFKHPPPPWVETWRHWAEQPMSEQDAQARGVLWAFIIVNEVHFVVCMYASVRVCVSGAQTKLLLFFYSLLFFKVTCCVHSPSQSLRWRRSDRVRLPVHPLSSGNATVRDASQCNSNERAITSVLTTCKLPKCLLTQFHLFRYHSRQQDKFGGDRWSVWELTLQLFNTIVFAHTFCNQQKWKSCAF